ncbi:Spray [Madurella fahalii]|uniref:Spray n=1 Tax=Madurella fahalii TaxID=1157608 RepID=A0ABQ0G8C0_9PEZI
MDRYPPRPRPPVPLRSATSSSALSRISTVSDFTDLDSFQDDLTGIPAQTQPYLVSHLSGDDGQARFGTEPDQGHIYPSAQSGWVPFTSHSGSGYSPVTAREDALLYQKQSRGYAHRPHEVIPEEEGIDLGLVGSAASSGPEETKNPSVRVSSVPAFDLSSVLGPTTKADEAFMRTLQEQEAQGKLTGGLGLGIRTDMTVTESALLAASPVSERPRSHSFSRASRRLSRTETVKRLGQSEANKRGEVIEVVMDEDIPSHSKVDLSLVAGHDTAEPLQFVMRQTTFPTKKTTAEVFYPQPNWKPFSMRWPYLLLLIILSLGLGAGVEALYQSSTRNPLVRFISPSQIPAAEYFAIKFLPMMVAVSYGVLWQITNFEVMRLEAFYQMSKDGGALAAESINVDYLTQFNLFRPFRALYCKHYAVAVSSVASLLANTLVPTLSAASIILSPDRETRLKFPNAEKSILIHHVWSRLLTTLFCVIAFLGCILFYQLQTRRSGLLADVKGIAGLASMATVSHILMDFKDMDVATHQDIHHRLKDHRYVLRNSSLAPDDLHPPSKQERDRYTKNHLSANPQPLMLRSAGVFPFVGAIALFTALLPVVLFTQATVLADRAPWLITAVAVIIKLSWGALETDVRLMEPYYILSRRHAPPKTLTLDYTAMPFGWVAVRGLLNRHWLVFFVGFGTVLAEILTVLVTSLATVEGRVFAALIHDPGAHADSDNDDDGAGLSGGGMGDAAPMINSGQETVPSFWLSLTVALLILVYMGVVACVVYLKRRQVFLPRQPNTIASVLAYIHQSKMLYGFVGTAKLGRAEMLRKLEGMGKTYGLGWFQGRDGQSHCGVDEEELLSGFRLGYDYSRATKPWEETEVNWL